MNRVVLSVFGDQIVSLCLPTADLKRLEPPSKIISYLRGSAFCLTHSGRMKSAVWNLWYNLCLKVHALFSQKPLEQVLV